MKWKGWREKERRKKLDKAAEIRVLPLKPGLKGKKSKSSGVLQAELTYINLTENNVYYAANHNQGVEHIPGIPKISLSEVERVVGRVKCDISTRTRRLYSHTEI